MQDRRLCQFHHAQPVVSPVQVIADVVLPMASGGREHNSVKPAKAKTVGQTWMRYRGRAEAGSGLSRCPMCLEFVRLELTKVCW
jgi:hypothetical protein